MAFLIGEGGELPGRSSGSSFDRRAAPQVESAVVECRSGCRPPCRLELVAAERRGVPDDADYDVALSHRADLRSDRAQPLGRLALALGRRADQDRDLAEVLVLAHELVRLGDARRSPSSATAPGGSCPPRSARWRACLLRVREVRAEDLLLAHPQVADVEVEVVARRAPQITTLPNGLTVSTEVGNVAWPTCSKTMSGGVAEDLLDALGEARATP